MNNFIKEQVNTLFAFLGVPRSLLGGDACYVSDYEPSRIGKWTIDTAIAYLSSKEGMVIGNRLILLRKEGLSGLKSCSAIDYLKRNGYYVR